jgi:gamma-glutamylcyclotransferase (GGCT)/AIG2-like uncharacterized protein YtfP
VSTFNLFVYGTLRAGGASAGLLAACDHLGAGTVHGTLYDVDGRFPALLRYGTDTVQGEIWRCPSELLLTLDSYEGISEGLFRRIADDVTTPSGDVVPCWLYAAGPALSRKLTPDRRISGGVWHAPAG